MIDTPFMLQLAPLIGLALACCLAQFFRPFRHLSSTDLGGCGVVFSRIENCYCIVIGRMRLFSMSVLG